MYKAAWPSLVKAPDLRSGDRRFNPGRSYGSI